MSLWKNFFTRNSVLELDHVTNVTIVLNENAASDWGSRSSDVHSLHTFFLALVGGEYSI